MTGASSDIFKLVTQSGLMVQFVLFVLLSFSAACWTIIGLKIRQLWLAKNETAQFVEFFWKSGNMAKSYAKAKQLTNSPVARAYRVAYMEMVRINQSSGNGQNQEGFSMGTDNIKRALRRANVSELTRLTQWVPFLATIGNTAPFIGLFGTVWGIMSAFHGIGQRGTATLAVVAPGISEALVATAAGLAAAIPAVMAYNHFTSRIRVAESQLNNFASDFINVVEREVVNKPAQPQQQAQKPQQPVRKPQQ
ncbi:protein TolQ [Desulfatibacillum aliphaticivorans]|uniref:protein TolQ n=1 Tax=Desulfatibacillum aliphaticivorans TaxID=218208 RepID=UPI000685FF1F|nr:protein TolQ [Desulfatibacillum aliphaticivorans]